MKCCSSGFWIRGKFGSTGGRGGGEKHGPLLVVAVDMIVIVYSDSQQSGRWTAACASGTFGVVFGFKSLWRRSRITRSGSEKG